MKIRFKRSHQTEKSDTENEGEKVSSRFLKKEHSSLFFLSYFLLIVGMCIGIAVVFRFFILVSKSTFSTSSYAMLIVSQNPFIVALDNASPKLNFISVPKRIQNNRIRESLSLGVPIDGEIKMPAQNVSKDSFPDSMFFISLIFRPWQYSYQDMTIIDAVRLTFSSLSISQKNASSYTIKLSKTGDIEGVTATQLYDIFKDPNIINEQVSIEIVNATSVQGLAGSAAQVLKNIGCNVVSITSADEKDVSGIIANSPSVTLTRVSNILGIRPQIDPLYHGITDMKIVLGQDFGDKVK